MCIIFASCIFFSYGFTICSVCVINENKNVLKSYYSTSDITTALSRALDYTKNNANKYNFLTIRISKGVYNVKKTLHLSSYTAIDLNKSFIKNAPRFYVEHFLCYDNSRREVIMGSLPVF